MKTSEPHNPAPWKTGREDLQSYDSDGFPFTNIYHATLTDGEHLGHKLPLEIGRAVGADNKANAAHIVKCVNAMPGNLAAMKEALQALIDETDGNNILDTSI